MSLAGRGVLVTRPANVAAALAQRVERAGARAIVFPAIEIADAPRPAEFDRLESFALAIFVSPTAVARALAMLGQRWPATVAVGAIGQGTRRALERAGLSTAVAPREGADSESLLATPELDRYSGKPVLIVRGVGGRDALEQALARRGCRVAIAECYRRVPPAADAAPLLAQWDEGRVDAVTIFSREALDNLATLVGEARLRRVPVFVAHARIAEHAARRGVRAIEAGASDDEMLERLVAYFHDRA
jgi:uroporphyrinogen-III synthase